MTPRTLALSVGVMIALSGIQPADRFTWWLEVFPAIALVLYIIVQRRLSITPLSANLLALWALILCIGAHYTYAEVPLFNWLKESFSLSRNYYDRVGHLAQGFIPAILFREYLLKRSTPGEGSLLFFLCSCFALALSASYELLEWWVSVATHHFTGEGATAFLGTQGDVWDTQWDMFCALIGSVVSQLTLSSTLAKQVAVTFPDFLDT